MARAVWRKGTSSSGQRGAIGTSSPYRRDVDGLRGIAILLVVAYHVGFGAFSAGYIGVDVFFVISGYLITRQLCDEARTTGAVDLLHFWSRRIQRLLPLASTVVVATVLATLLVLNPLEWHDRFDEALAGTFYFANEHFADARTDYFADVRRSPFLHLWSLSLEEQFYVVWPMLFIGALWWGRRFNRPRSVPVVVAAAIAVSALLSWAATAAGSNMAYYALASRGWELGAGAGLAIAWPRVGGRWRDARLAGVGVGSIVLGHVLLQHGMAFPMPGGLLPVLGTALVITAQADSRTPTGRLLTSEPLVRIGLLSYGWYLWHWPFLVLGSRGLGTDSVWARTMLAVLALAAAAATSRYVEHALRRPRLTPVLSIGSGVVLILVAVASIGFAREHERTVFARPELAGLRAASNDFDKIFLDCATLDAIALAEGCTDGHGREPPIMLIGDSHMNHWRRGIEGAARELDRPVVRSILGDCVSIGHGRKGGLPACDTRSTENILPLVDHLKPAVVVLSHASTYRDLRDQTGAVTADQIGAWADSHESFAQALHDRRIPLIVILDTPRYPDDPVACLAGGGTSERCSVLSDSVRDQHAPVNRAIARALADAGHGTILDPVDFMCPDRACLLRTGDIVVQQDSHHITRTFASAQSERLRRAIAAIAPS